MPHSFLDELLEKEEAMFGKYRICLVQNKRQLRVFIGNDLIFDKPASWAAYWQMEEMIKE